MARSLFALVLVSLLSGGCSLIVEDMLQNKTARDGGNGDSGLTGRTCAITEDCLRGDQDANCTQVCVGAMPGQPGHCVTGMRTPDGTFCRSTDGERICVNGSCVIEGCGDGYVNRAKANPEYCDEGEDNVAGGHCDTDCSRRCGPTFPNCLIGTECNGVETCNTATSRCEAPRVDRVDAFDGMSCTDEDDQAGTCSMGACVPN